LQRGKGGIQHCTQLEEQGLQRWKHCETTLKKLRNKYAPKNAPSLAKLHKSIYGAKLEKNVDPNVFIVYLEDLRSRMEDMNSAMTYNQFILHVVNKLTEDCMNQVKKIRYMTDPLALHIEDVREELNLEFEGC
jgi:threonine aldolase